MGSVDHNNASPSTSQTASRVVRCPNCGGDSVYATSNPARPFCSDRCKNMDFGAWASEGFRVPATTTPEEQEINGADLYSTQLKS
ncbi:DNA gyrase inhibitor YacG [Candidatus Aalborgicola defluviihabitans]|uniref:DNA gyrase inhibitor YacG n=1 Tax=Candidatus Aalborgicola defluviihabitans TaxID=3386187 RepID=UPI001D47E344|nr:DNA gyrase inhibitor YacG [Burkholderiales bacterium]MBK6569428.1 DNA gyrase inhibitor YacG [Burkholderiales bacterium]MBK7280847.1 DNA gyrase inhibitor YacG [Burkholderiales bacterium]MBK7315880.1 DNA gyrase inhibitor YacG [Burkholderiales bacterium]MBL0243879.1 DNA gyrase inhibitor YacG [Rhodoferax sp.]